jgi:hypothetical protein
MARALPLVLLALAAWGGGRPAGAEDAGVEGAGLDLSQARVLASPGWPPALEGFLPPGRTVEPLTLPLPPGPLLVLGLVGQDDAARRLAARRLAAGEGLRGGYLVDAEEHAGHAVALLLADDAAALAAARFELETFTPEAKAGAARSLDMTQPDEQGGVRIARGRRTVRPAFRIRALGGLEHQGSLLDAASAHANRLWLATPRPVTSGRPRSLALLAEHGVVPVAWAQLEVAGRGPASEAEVARVLGDLRAWQAEGVRHFALLLPDLASQGPRAARERHAELVRALVPPLRVAGLDEVLVVPRAGSDPATWPDMRGIPEALVGWVGPDPRPLEVTRAQAERIVERAGVPVVFMETWMSDVWGLPSLPRGRDPGLGEVLAGVVVLPGPGAVDAVAHAWSPQATPPTLGPALDELLDCCVADPSDAEAWLVAGAQSLEQALEGRFGAPLWQRGLPRRMREDAAALPPADQRLLVWYDPQARRADGSLDPACWDAAPVKRLGPAEVRAVSDGELIALRVRVPRDAGARRLSVALGPHHPATRLDLGGLVFSVDELGPTVVQGGDAGHTVATLTLDRNALHGDPHPGRVLPLGLEVTTDAGVHRLGPTAPALSAPTGALIIVR